MPLRVADGFVTALLYDDTPTMAASVDFGLDKNPRLYKVYQRKVRSGDISADDLHRAVGNGKKLTDLLGVEVITFWDVVEEEKW